MKSKVDRVWCNAKVEEKKVEEKPGHIVRNANVTMEITFLAQTVLQFAHAPLYFLFLF